MTSTFNAGRKRKQEDDPDLLEFDSEIDHLLLKLQEKGGLDLTAFGILDMAAAPSFSNASWSKVAPAFHLDKMKNFYQLPTFSFSVTLLPPSFHKELMRESAKWLDVYRERDTHEREAARVRLMDAWHVPICALFKGRLVDRPESSMPETPETFGSEVEHEVYMTEGIILLVFELKLALLDKLDNVAQVLLELASAYKQNSDKEFEPQPPVYAILTDLQMFHFFRYNGDNQFARTEEIFVSSESRPKFLAGMRRVSEHLFSILLEGYIGTLVAVVDRSTRRGDVGDVSEHSSFQAGKETPDDLKVPGTTRRSPDRWWQALTKARKAQQILTGYKGESLESWENVGRRGLLCLDESVSLLTKIGSNTDWDKITLENEIDKVLLSAINEP